MLIRREVTKTNLLVFTPPWSSTVACWGQEFCFCTRPLEPCAGAWEAVEDTGMCFPLPLPLPFSSHSEKVTKNFSHLPLNVLCVYVCACPPPPCPLLSFLSRLTTVLQLLSSLGGRRLHRGTCLDTDKDT